MWMLCYVVNESFPLIRFVKDNKAYVCDPEEIPDWLDLVDSGIDRGPISQYARVERIEQLALILKKLEI